MTPPSKESVFLKTAREYIAKDCPGELSQVTRFYLIKNFLAEVEKARREGFEAAREGIEVNPYYSGELYCCGNPRPKYHVYQDYLKELEKDESLA